MAPPMRSVNGALTPLALRSGTDSNGLQGRLQRRFITKQPKPTIAKDETVAAFWYTKKRYHTLFPK